MDTNQLLQDRRNLMNYRQALRAKERSLQARARALAQAPVVDSGGGDIQKLERSFRQFLPESHIPGNVGGLNRVAWDFNFVVDFDFGIAPAFDNTVSQTQEFQNTQEAAFIILASSRASSSDVAAKAPLTIDFKDRQSSRFLMDRPIPFQALGSRSRESIMTTPFLLMPNAKLQVTIAGFTTFPVTVAGPNAHQLRFFGYRIRVEDADKVLTAVFGR